MPRISRLVAALVILPLALVACAPQPRLSPDERAMRAVILRYDELLTDGYRSLDMTGIREVATELQAEDEYIHMSSLAEGGVRLDAQVKDVRFVSVSVEATSARVETRETWDYRHYSRKDGKLLLVQNGQVYDLAWDLTRQSGNWLVSDVRAIGSTATVPAQRIATPTPSATQVP